MPTRARHHGAAAVKLAPPRLAQVYVRERLCARLDTLAQHPLTWIDGPAGSGKTTLAASYLEQRQLASVWYRVDAADADLATVFHYLGIGLARLAPSLRRSLPALTPDHLPTIGRFAHTFFGEACRRVRHPFAIVFDNCESVGDDSAFATMLAGAAEALAGHARVIALSRRQPPAAQARAVLHEYLVRLDAADLRLTADEALGLAAARWGALQTEPARERAHRAWARADGWMAGVVLQLAARSTADGSPSITDAPSRQLLFDYFAREVFDRIDDRGRATLLTIAELPHVSAALLTALTGTPDAIDIVADLHRQNYFVSRSTAADTYRLHPLFREFLAARQRSAFTPAEHAALRRRVARLLEESGAVDAALDTYRLVPDWDGVARVVLEQAAVWAAQSRLQTLNGWLSWLPDAVVEREPWLLYWRGVCRTMVAPEVGRRDLQRAYVEFERRNDADGSYAAWAAIIRTLFAQWSDFSEVDEWVARFEALRARHPTVGPAIAPEVAFGVICALTHRYLHHGDVQEWMDRAEALLHAAGDDRHPLWLELRLVTYLHNIWTGRVDRARALIRRIESSVRDLHYSPSFGLAVSNILAIDAWLLGDPRAAEAIVQEALVLGSTHQLAYWKHQIIGQGATAAVVRGDRAAASAYLAQMRASVGEWSDSPLYGSHIHWIAATAAIEAGEPREAAEQARSSLELARAARFTFGEACAAVAAANAAFLCGSRDDASMYLSEARALAERTHSDVLRLWCAASEAAWGCADHSARVDSAFLAEVLALSRSLEGPAIPGIRRSWLAALYGTALDRGIEVDHAAAQIRRFLLPMPADGTGVEGWPLPVKVYTFGRFAIVRDGQPVRFATKAQKRPIDLLKILIALGGRGVDEAAVADALWPDSEADLARQSLKSTLYRTRKLVGPHAITVDGGKLTLDPGHCWVDVWTFERLLNAVLESPVGSPASSVSRAMDAAMRVYQGPFLNGDVSPAAHAMRDRLRGRLVLAIERVASLLEADGSGAQSVRYLERGLEVDPLYEPLYQQLISAHLTQDRVAEALRVYDRCATELQRMLAARPSRHTEALRERARRLAG